VKPWFPALGLAVALGACSQQTVSSVATLLGTYDLVIVDERPDGELASREGTGVPARYLFVTSSDTNDLRVIRLWREDLTRPQVVRAPNPLEALAIPVLDRPTMLVADEGISAAGARVTGSYVFATHPGASELSIVPARPNAPAQLRQLGGRPFPTPAPVTAFAATLGSGLTALPATSTLYFSTWDGARGALYALELPTDSSALGDSFATLTPRLVLELGAEVVLALQPVPRQASRTALGSPFCDANDCLAISTRAGAGGPGRMVLFDPASRRMVRLGFPGTVRDFAMSTLPSRLYALLDEATCGGPQCGGVVTVTLTATDASGGYPLAIDFTGQPMQPLRLEGALATGLTVAENAALRTTTEVTDGGAGLEFQYQTFAQLGAIAASNGEVTYFDALAGVVLDYDARPAEVTAGSYRLPEALADGGVTFFAPDGGARGSALEATVTLIAGERGEPFRAFTLVNPELPETQAPFVFDVSDGFFASQSFFVTHRGHLPGLFELPTSAADGTSLPVPAGVGERALVGDTVRFEVGSEATGYQECGRADVTTVTATALEVAAVPSGCEARSRFSVRAAGSKPLVANAELEGYLGRGAAGQTLTWQRRYASFPSGYVGPRVALNLTLGDNLPPLEGAFLTIALNGRSEAYRLSVDAQTVVNCSSQLPAQFVLGNLVMAEVPTAQTGSSSPLYNWTLWGAVPSANGVLELDQRKMRRGLLGSAEAFCHR
jgi:hypothetical protein